MNKALFLELSEHKLRLSVSQGWALEGDAEVMGGMLDREVAGLQEGG